MLNMKKIVVLLAMVLGVIPCTNASITIQTKIFDANAQPPIVGGVIGDYSEGSLTKKGIIVSVNNNDLLYDAQSEISFPYYYSGREDKLNYTKELRIIDCSNAGKEQFWSPLLFLKSGTYYYIRAYAVKKDGSVIYGQTESLRSLSFSRYNGRSDYGNVWHAFDNTLFDLVTDEIINPNNGFFYSTNENPTTVRQQTGTGYNTCYKFATKWNYQLWYYHSMHCVQNKIIDMPLMSYSDNKLYIEKNPADAEKDISFYYSINGNFFRPETYTSKYTAPITISEPCTVYCYAISSDGYMSYTNMYVVASSEVSNNSDKVPDVVDLGLTSGTLWATCNIGASSPEDYGYYFAWGETAPKSNYAWSTYKYGNGSNFTKYNSTDKLTQLKLEDDAAYVILGKDWRMPTHAEELELAKECSWESVTINGTSGYKITGPNGKSIFMPRGGLYDGTDYASDGSTPSNVNTGGWYWSSSLNSAGSAYAQGFCFYPSLLTNVCDHERSDGHNIRPVYVGESNDNNGVDNNEDNTFGKVANVVDLGLSVKWASWNVGASKIGDYGGLYGMGDPTGLKNSTSYTDYFWKNGESICGTEYDLAKAKWGESWRLPTTAEIKELKEKCSWENNVTIDGVTGSVVTGPNGKTIFIPYAGHRIGNTIYQKDEHGSIWTGDMGVSLHSYGYMDVDVNSDGTFQWDGCENYIGQSVRPVYVNSTHNASFPDVVDLGLSVKWASWNVGAEKPEGLGNLYAWGELSPKTDYSSSTYKFYNGGYTKYGSVDNKYRLDSEDDIATQAWGDNWRMPTFKELKELKEKCSFTKTELNGVPVTKVVGPNGNFIYFPYPGNYTGKTLYYENSIGSYWSSDLESDSYAQDIDYISGMPSLNGDTRYHGQAVRPVYGNGASTKCVVNLESAGKLKEKLNNTNSGEILDLKISGYMDARDFDFIKWHCMKVRNVDLSEVKIEAYTGSDGTNEGYNDTYAANEIPLGAFFYWTTSYKYNYEGMPSDEGMPSLKSIKLPNGIKAIRRNAFARAYNLTEINIPEGVETIDYVAFAICQSLAEITLPSSLKEVGKTAFADMPSLKTVYINAANPPTCVSDAFQNLSNDAVLYVPKGSKYNYQTATGWKTFKTILEIGGADQIFEVGGVRYIVGDNNEVSVIRKDGGYAGDVIIPTGVFYNGATYTVSAIEMDAFDDCNNLQVVILPQAIYDNGIPVSVKKFVTYSNNPMRVEVKSKGATSAILNIDPLNEIGNTTVTMLGMIPGQLIKWILDDENYGIISDKTESTLALEVQPALATSTTKARLSAIINEADDDLHYGFEWLRNDAPEGMPSNAVTASLHAGRIVGSLGGLNPDIYYKYRPFYQSDSGKKFYGEWIPFLTGDANVFFEPETHTKEASEITQMSALLAAVWVEGTDDIQEKGFEYWPLPVSNISKTRASEKEVMVVAVSGNKTSATIEGLAASTEYAYRSYAKTASGTTYGESLTFKTNIVGDVNNDGYLNEKDVNDLVDYTMGKTPVGFNKKAADLNGDKEVNVADIVKLVNIKNNSSNESK